MTPHQFIARWKPVTLTEMSAYQQHFLDLCDLFGVEKPAAADPTGAWFTFQKGLTTTSDNRGFADVWRQGCFGWEYKGKHKDLKAAYDQLLRYREALENPPLLVVCDMDKFVIRTNFTGTPTRKYEFDLDGLADPANLNVLQKAFTDPDALKPGVTKEQVTEEIARRFCKVADGLRSRKVDSDRAAHFLVRLVFCMFAEHAGLLTTDPRAGRVFTDTLRAARNDPKRLSKLLAGLFDKMGSGGDFGPIEIRHINGGLFNNAEVIDLTPDEITNLLNCANADWSGIEPTISGTLFERIIDPAKRAQLGAHYTSLEDIETLLRPVFLDPLRREWAAVRAEADGLWFLVTPNVTKHRLFIWMVAPTLPDHQLIVFARSDDYFFGVMHSRVHEVWARAQGTQVRERESGFRYTPTTCFETFPFPEPFAAHRNAIGAAAKELDQLRSNWLNPPEWTRTEVLEFPGSADGPWRRYVHDVNPARGIGTVRYPRIVPKDAGCAAKLKTRTLTGLYNTSPDWLKAAHKKLDELVFAAYGWSPDLSDEGLLARLLELNLERSAAERDVAAKPARMAKPTTQLSNG